MPQTMPWIIGFGSVCITPDVPMLLAGYAGNERLHSSVSCDIHVRAMWLTHRDGAEVVFLAFDLCGIDQETVGMLRQAASARWQLRPEQLVINCSHNHSAPNIDTTLSLYYDHSPDLDAQVAGYTQRVRQAAIQALAMARECREQATLHWGQGLAGLATNRRRSRPGGRSFAGLVDHDVPVLAARRPDGDLIGCLFGYACHTTSLCGRDLNADYPGFAMAELESQYAGAAFVFLAGCGADQNPLPRFRPELCRAYGLILARAVEDVLQTTMQQIDHPPVMARWVLELPIVMPTRDDLARQMEQSQGEVFLGRLYRNLLAQADRGELASHVLYPLQLIRFGSQLNIAGFGGETVVAYSLHAKQQLGWDATMALGYCDWLTPYIPSAQVLREGGYEADSLPEYGYAGTISPDLEPMIYEALANMVAETMHLGRR